MSKKVDDLFEQIEKNLTTDREQLVRVRDELMNLASGAGDMTEDGPLVRMTVVAEIVRLTDSATKVNTQMLELTKTRIRRDLVENTSKGETKKDMEGLWNEMEKSSPMS